MKNNISKNEDISKISYKVYASIHKTNKSNCYCEFSKVNIILQCHALLHYLTFLDNIDHHLITGTDNQVNHKVIIHCE